MPETSNNAAHESVPYFWEAGSEHCPHGAEPDRNSPDWDVWNDRHSPADDVCICLDAPMGDRCADCSDIQGEAVECQIRVRAVAGDQSPTDNAHRPITIWVGTADCFERECEEYVDDDGDDRPEVKRCSHITEEVVCEGCSKVTADDYFEPAVPWAGPHSGEPAAEDAA